MNFIRYIVLILISISLIGCVNTKTNKRLAMQNSALRAEAFKRAPDQALVDFYKTCVRTDRIIESSTSTPSEKRTAEDEQEAAGDKLFLAADTNLSPPQYSEEDKKLAAIDFAMAMKQAEKNNIDLSDVKNRVEAILSLPTYKAARIIRIKLK